MRRVIGSLALVAGFALSAAAGPMPAPPTLTAPPPNVGFSGGDGSSCTSAVVITGASHEVEGIRAERWWVFSKNPGAAVEKQEVSSTTGKDLETFTLISPDGSRKTVCFDITSFYGKL